MKSEKGQSLVEFALILPLFLLLLFGVVDFGRALHAYITIDHAGREAARAASVGETDDEKVKKIAVDKAAGISLESTMVAVSPGPYTSGTDVTITITYPFTFITPVIEPWITWVKGKKTIDIADTTVMRVE